MRPPELDRPDVYLRSLRVDDAAAWLEYLSDPRAIELTSYDIRSIDEVRSMIDGYAATQNAGGPARWAIALRENDALVGTCGFHSWAPRDLRAEIGYDLSPALWGRGIASASVAATVTSAFAATNLNRIDAFVMVENTTSQRVLEKCGFTKEGRLARYRNCRGTFRDFYIYGLLSQAIEQKIVEVAKPGE